MWNLVMRADMADVFGKVFPLFSWCDYNVSGLFCD